MIVQKQRSDYGRIWFDAAVSEAAGILTIPATTFCLHGRSYALPAYAPVVGTGPFRLVVEKVGGSADYMLDLTGFAEPVSFGEGIGAPVVAWRDADGGDIHVLRSVPDVA